MRRRSLLLTPLVALAVGMPSAAISAENGIHSPNLTHVANHPHFQRTLDGERVGGGSDIEFATIAVEVGVDAEGEPVFEDRDFALAGSYSNGLQIVDITDPQNPTTASVYDCVIQQGDVQVFTREGRTYAAYTMDDGYGSANRQSQCYVEARQLGFSTSIVHGTFIADITDPYHPTTVSFLAEERGSHNATVAPGGKYIYNSNSDLGAGNPQIEIWSIEDFAKPERVFTLDTLTGLSAHDITFNEDGTRAYAAAVTHSLVIDTTDQAQPEIIGRILDPAINIHHQSDPVTLTDATTGLERTFLVVTDELAGAGGNGACPGGGLHIYDITGPLEMAPVKVGYWNIPSVRATNSDLGVCTSHVLRMHPEQGIMTIAWYDAGVRIVDISGLIGVSVGADETQGNVGVGMKEIGYHRFDNSDTWSAKTNRIEEDGSFYLYGNDLERGLDVYRFEASAPEASNPGTWLTPEQALERARSMGVLSPGIQEGPFCLYVNLSVG